MKRVQHLLDAVSDGEHVALVVTRRDLCYIARGLAAIGLHGDLMDDVREIGRKTFGVDPLEDFKDDENRARQA